MNGVAILYAISSRKLPLPVRPNSEPAFGMVEIDFGPHATHNGQHPLKEYRGDYFKKFTVKKFGLSKSNFLKDL